MSVNSDFVNFLSYVNESGYRKLSIFSDESNYSSTPSSPSSESSSSESSDGSVSKGEKRTWNWPITVSPNKRAKNSIDPIADYNQTVHQVHDLTTFPRMSSIETTLQYLFREHACLFNDYTIKFKSGFCATLSPKPDSLTAERRGEGLEEINYRLVSLGLRIYVLRYNAILQLEVDCEKSEIDDFEKGLADWMEQQTGDVSEAVSRIKEAFNTDSAYLSLSNLHLSSLPSVMGKLKKLKMLDLGNNNLQSLPWQIWALPELRRLNAAGNQLTELSIGINQRSRLVYLNLKGNHFQVLPEEIRALTELVELDMEGNQLTHLPNEISTCRKLEHLNFRNNRFSTFPAVILTLPELIRLNMEGNQLTELPNEVSKSKKLRVLNMANNQLTDLPDGVRELSDLRQLNIGKSQVQCPLWMKDFFNNWWHFKLLA